MDHENETDTELVTETLVEEVSIDRACPRAGSPGGQQSVRP
jgi:mycofactocin precursor